jgi:hypothetical protein
VAFWYQLGPSKKFTEIPNAEQRKLPSLDRIVVWGMDFVQSDRHGAGRVRLQEGARYLESGGQLFFQPRGQKEGFLAFDFEVKEKEPLRLLLELTRSYDYGVWQPYLNGVKIGSPINLYRPEPDLREFHLIDFWPDPGNYTLRLKCVGKDRLSTGYNIGVNSIRLRERRPRVKTFGYDRDNDWTKEQLFYK